MSVLYAIPWRNMGDSARTRNLKFVQGWLKNLTGQKAVLVDGDGERFSLAAARNKAFSMVDGSDVVVVCDADTLVSPLGLRLGVNAAVKSRHVVLPFTLFRAFGRAESNKIIRGSSPEALPDIGSLDWSVGGIQAARADTWWALGGQDERFTGWGCEDSAFAIVAEKLGVPHMRMTGTIYHLWHPSSPEKDEENPAYKFNEALLQRYMSENVRDLVDEHRNPVLY